MQQGIVYKKTGQRSRGSVHHYHGKPAPLKLTYSPFKVDVAGLKPVQQRANIFFNGLTYHSKFTIGMEVEKNELSRGAVKEYELFCGFERDGSCGYEAVTHILPLLPAGSWRTKVFDMMHKAERIIDDRFSPSDKRCGGHITIGVEGMDGIELNEKVRKHAGIILALFRHRLNTKYCGANRRMQAHSYDTTFNSWGGSYEYNSREWHRKYQTALVKGDVLEFRVPSRFDSVKQMMRRYELFYEIVDFSINCPNGSHLSLMNRLRPIIISLYNGNVEKAEEIIGLAKHFRKFILDGTIHQDIANFLQ
jgi:hypothetical protein